VWTITVAARALVPAALVRRHPSRRAIPVLEWSRAVRRRSVAAAAVVGWAASGRPSVRTVAAVASPLVPLVLIPRRPTLRAIPAVELPRSVRGLSVRTVPVLEGAACGWSDVRPVTIVAGTVSAGALLPWIAWLRAIPIVEGARTVRPRPVGPAAIIE
jgi:hypothetical protein